MALLNGERVRLYPSGAFSSAYGRIARRWFVWGSEFSLLWMTDGASADFKKKDCTTG
jgi:hypothetical protein